MISDPVLDSLLDQVEIAQQAVRLYLASRDPDLVPMKIVAHHWGVTLEAAYKRVKRGGFGVKKGRLIYVPRTSLTL